MNVNLLKLTKHLPKGVHRAALVIRKFSPEILTGLGIVSGAGCVVMACKATLKVNDIIDEYDEIENKIDITLDRGFADYTERDAKKDIVVAKVQTAGKIVKAYSPAIALGLGSASCILGAHGIMHKRNAAITAAYSLIQGQFNDYRNRVREELGNDKDKQFLYGLKAETVVVDEVNPETGRKKKVKKTVTEVGPDGYSIYAKCFDNASKQWVDDAEMNLLFLRGQQEYANTLLHTRGHVFLNDIYDSLDIPRTQAGAVVGWLDDGSGDNYIDFGIYSLDNQMAIDFVNGYEDCIWLDFNVDGVIFDKI